MKPEIFTYFEKALEMGASDLVLNPGAPPSYRVNKHLIISEDEALASQQMFDLFLPVINAAQQEEIHENFSTSAIFTLGSTQTRIRYYIYQTRDGVAGSFRFIPNKVPTVEELGLPDTLVNIASMPRGLFLVTGPVCSGKTLTVSAMAEAINERFARHIITMENEIEIVYKPKQSVFTQVEIGKVIPTYSDALTNALREDPDVMILGELGEQGIIEQALMAAETGHLVISSLPTFGPAQTIEHIISLYPAGKQDEARSQLSLSLIGIFSQILIPSIDYKTKASVAYELMLVNSGMRNLIRDKKYNQLTSSMIMARREGCVTFKDSLERLKRNENLDQEYISSLLQELEQ